jgi:hypothetical protein
MSAGGSLRTASTERLVIVVPGPAQETLGVASIADTKNGRWSSRSSPDIGSARHRLSAGLAAQRSTAMASRALSVRS